MINKVYLSNLLQTEDFQDLLKALEEKRPVIPAHTVNPDNTEEWKSKSASQNGFDLIFKLIRGL